MDISSINERVIMLCNILRVLEGQHNDPECQIEEKCIELFTCIDELKDKYSTVEKMMNETSKQIEVLRARIKDIKMLRARMAYMKENMEVLQIQPKFEPKELVTEEVNVTVDEFNERKHVPRFVSPLPKTHLPVPYQQQAPPKAPTATSTSKTFSTNEYPKIQFISDDELSTVPKYMKGRFTTEHLNKLIESLNAVYQKKYDTLSKTKKSLKPNELDMYYEWKRTENMEPRGCHFITIKDVNSLSDKKMDKTSLNMMPILRHLKRIRETRHANNQIHYILQA